MPRLTLPFRLAIVGLALSFAPSVPAADQADAFTPGPPNGPAPNPPNAYHVNLVQNLDRLKLDVDRILPLHGRMVPLAELKRMVGK